MRIDEFDYHLPRELIAQRPVEPRDHARLLVIDRKSRKLQDAHFYEIGNWLVPGDLLVVNDTRVVPARIFGRVETGGKMEFLLLRRIQPGRWEALARPARRARPGTVVEFDGVRARVVERKPEGVRVVEFTPGEMSDLILRRGEVALPPYIRERCATPDRYQTVYARRDGAVAAPTAGLHFTPELLRRLCDQGVELAVVTLHASLGTFRPIRSERVEEHRMYPEEFEISELSAERINRALSEGRRVIGVGTTTVRVLETQAQADPGGVRVRPGRGETDLFIYPGYRWKVTGALLTNFHLPKSTLLLLVCAFADRQLIMDAYAHAIAHRYRFYSFGDAMLIV